MSANLPETRPPAFELPSRTQALWFWFRIRMLTLQRMAQDAAAPHVRRWPPQPRTQSALADAPALAELNTPLWSDGRSDEFALVAGKVHNLRLAVRAFDGMELPAGAMLSFWQQLGRITARKGFVLGREIREGCVVPTLGGGICQLSNALATVATRAGLTLVERHGHTALIEAANRNTQQTDATVLWKHIDLRIATDRALRWEVQMSSTHLTVRLRGAPVNAARSTNTFPVHLIQRQRDAATQPVVRSCVTCNEQSCFRHQPELAELAGQQGSSTTLLDGLTPELATFLEHNPQWQQRLLLPEAVTAGQRQQVNNALAGKHWGTKPASLTGRWVALRRALWLRWHAKSQGKRQGSVLDGQHWQASHALRQLQATDTRLLVDQAYLPALWQSGQLAGRELRVWMPALPMQMILEQLDRAAALWPDEPSLRDFRPNAALVAAELAALQQASLIITPHHGVAQWASQHLKAQVKELKWKEKPPTVIDTKAHRAIKTIVFPASTLARKGWRELGTALQLLPAEPLELVVLGTVFQPANAAPPLPSHVQLRSLSHHDDWLQQADAVVLPAHVEHNPRALRAALAAGLPVIATAACGLPAQAGLTLVTEGDIQALAKALAAIFEPNPPRNTAST